MGQSPTFKARITTESRFIGMSSPPFGGKSAPAEELKVGNTLEREAHEEEVVRSCDRMMVEF